jgi:hypothetical protein|nr:MAG TPA: hypothetical protein [Caudoviricetes sp.]
MLNEKEIAVYIEIAKKPFTLKGFHVKGGFLLLKNSTGKTLAVSSGWHSGGCLAVYPLRDDCTYTDENGSKRFVWASYGDERFPCVDSYLDYIEDIEQAEMELQEWLDEQAEKELPEEFRQTRRNW